MGLLLGSVGYIDDALLLAQSLVVRLTDPNKLVRCSKAPLPSRDLIEFLLWYVYEDGTD